MGGPRGTLGSPAPSDLIVAGSTAAAPAWDGGGPRLREGTSSPGSPCQHEKRVSQKLQCKWGNPLTYVYVCSQSVSG